MTDAYYENSDELARFYAERMAKGFGPSTERKLGWNIRDALAVGDRRRAAFWERVREFARQYPIERGRRE
jgi:hypothetical protein